MKQFVHNLEEVFVRFLDEDYGILAERHDKHRGVWVGNEKITAIGLAIEREITMHGFAFNINTDLDHFKWIVPCGISDKGVTSLKRLTESPRIWKLSSPAGRAVQTGLRL